MLTGLSTGSKGAWAELVAAEVLLSMGLNVYRNISPNGKHDLIVESPSTGKCLGIDVTLGRYASTGPGRLTSQAKTKLEGGPKGQRACVIVVTESRELFIADINPYEIEYEGFIYKFTVEYTALTLEALCRRVM